MKNKNLIKNFTLPKHNTNNCRSTKKLFTKLEFRHPRDNTNGETNAVNNRKTNKKKLKLLATTVMLNKIEIHMHSADYF